MVAKAAGNTGTNTFNFGGIAWDSCSGGFGGSGGGGGISWGSDSIWSTAGNDWNTGNSMLGTSTPDMSFDNNTSGLFCSAPQTSDYASPVDHFNSDPLASTGGYDFHSVTGNGPDTASTFTDRSPDQTGSLPVTDLPSVTVTATPARSSEGTNSEMDAAAAYAGLTGSILDGGALATGRGPYGITLNWSKPAGYDALLIGNGGRLPSYVARPALEGINIGTDAAALREANYVLNLNKATPWLEKTGRAMGIAGLAIEGANAVASGDPGQYVHTGVDMSVFATTLAIGEAVSGPVGWAVGGSWTLLDTVIQHDTYHGLRGWSAALARHGDNTNYRREILRKNNPDFMFLGDK